MTPADFICRVPRELAETYADWQECAAFRIRRISDDEVVIEVTKDLERLTRSDTDGGQA